MAIVVTRRRIGADLKRAATKTRRFTDVTTGDTSVSCRVTSATREEGRLEGLLSVRNVEVVYNDIALVLRGVSLDVPKGSIVALLGANGAGKTTLLRAITGLLGVHRGKVTKGAVALAGDEVSGLDPATVVKRGIAQVMEGRRIFQELTVEENLRAGGFTRRGKPEAKEAHERVMDLFPVLRERRKATAGYLSGGEQQMLAMGRALMAAPTLLLLDEPSLGLAPKLVEQIRDIVVDINRQGTSVLLVEQNATMALSVARSGYVMETGRIVKEGAASELLADQDIQEFYLGVGESGRRSFRDVKSYRRRKRWSA
jgi:branched-chain amino acid transport system ATP-binding protein